MKDYLTPDTGTDTPAPETDTAKPSALDMLGNSAIQGALFGGGGGGDSGGSGFSWTGAGIGAGLGTLLGGPLGGLIGGGLGGVVGGMLGGSSQRSNLDVATDKKTGIADMPDQISLPDSVDKGMNDAWAGSLPGGNSQEQGGMIVRDKSGNIAFKKGNAGDSGSFDPDYSAVGPDETLVGVGHTHPYGKNDGKLDGATGVPFSGQDLSRLCLVDDRMALVQSGDSRFAATRSKEFDDMLAGKTMEQRQQMKGDMDKLWQDTFDGSKGTFQERCDAAVRAVAGQYKLGYYTGKGKDLNRVDTSK